MSASPFDSSIYRDLLADRETARLFTDSAEVRAMLIVEGALARAQGAAGLIPEVSAAAIHRASLELQIDPGSLASGVDESAVPVPALVRRFRDEMQAPEHAQWVHYGATSQDIMDTALTLRLRQVLARTEERLTAVLTALAAQADTHAALPMTGRTYGQAAVPTSFGALAAAWGRPLVTLAEGLAPLKEQLLRVSLGGAAGTLSAMGAGGAQVRAELAQGLGLGDPGGSWHTARQPIAALSAFATQVTGALGKMGADLTLLGMTGIGEITLPASGASSTMPQKRNPVLPAALSALAAQTVGLNHTIQAAQVHTLQRDGSAWIGEWLALPQVCIAMNRALDIAATLAEGITPNADAMRAALSANHGLIHAEALSFHLAHHMPRPEAQARVKALCNRAVAEDRDLSDLAAETFPDQDLAPVFADEAALGLAPVDARNFASAARAAVSLLSGTAP
ncbi:lyase family protein [Pelagovum pacificum]|uniref:Adenylosuccinate lyase family protein n=2 Tax=Pelagovum pacificum TaxID=2588711 RepID=A0A5C5GF47_9RHOB|nr:lyase family protein [Pelagovum pacificum]QQA44888.1 adenylosuccinate lyase family protein [Pelagovum pacificum]TNY33385.1 adenylosuccinate lyase family protein [Pelagovum pacificum]